jgi:Zn-dependent protease
MILQLFRGLQGDGSVDMAGVLVEFAVVAVAMFLCLPVHECAHAWAAKKLGDDTAWMHGRLTLSPSKHLDLFGTLLLLFAGFGYAKPVPVNPRNFKNGNYKKGMALTSAAGPLSNLIMAFAFMFLAQLFGMMVSLSGWANMDAANLIWEFLLGVAGINVSLMVFNLIPVHPLDGSRILDLFLPDRLTDFLYRYERYLMFAVFLVAFVFSRPLGVLKGWIFQGIYFLTGLPFFWVEAVI